MSEYQYYEFRTIDRPLTEAQKLKISALSSRAHVKPRTWTVRGEIIQRYDTVRKCI